MSDNEQIVAVGLGEAEPLYTWGIGVNYKSPQIAVWLVGQTYGRCWYCGKDFYANPRAFTVDHVIPQSRGGRHVLRNLLPCCSTCNVKKRTKTYEEFRNWLKERTGKELFWYEERIAKRRVRVEALARAEIAEYKKLRGIR